MDDLSYKANVIDKLIKQCEQSKLVSFAYQEPKFSISFSKVEGEQSTNVSDGVTMENSTQLDKMKMDIDRYAVSDISQMDVQENEGVVIIMSPFVGTVEFSNQIKLGSNDIHVDKGDVICSIEAMKIFNDIKSPATGSIVEILVKDCSLVEYEQPILKIRVDKNE